MLFRNLKLAIFIAIFSILNAVYSMDLSWVAEKYRKNSKLMKKLEPKI